MPYLRVLLLGLLAVPAFAAEPEKPRLVVLVVFDQMRGDYLERWKPLFGKDGFVRLMDQGAHFTNCHYPYAVTATGPGHASMLTGCGPDVHGIIGNSWYDRPSGAVVNCAQSPRYTRIPPLPADLPTDELRDDVKAAEAKAKTTSSEGASGASGSTAKPKPLGCPDRLLAPTFGDALKAATAGKARVIGLSLKDRSAIFPVGPRADGAYWVDSTDGQVITSTFFRDAVHPWVAEFNRQRVVDQWFGTPWERVRPDLDYDRHAGPDLAPGEGKGIRQGVTFPHPMDGGLKRPGKAYYEAVANSPYGNELLLALARAAVRGEQLGQDDIPDLLTVSFASSDIVGHAWGPDSHEVLDITLRADRLMAEFLTFLDETVGKGKYLVGLTADHGICPLPEASARRGLDAQRVSVKKSLIDAEAHLRAVYDPQAEEKSTVRFLENVTAPWVYLNHKAIAAKGLESAAVARTLAEYLTTQPGILRAITRADLEGELDPYDAVGRRMRLSYHPDRSGDVALVLKPFWLDGEKTSTGTTHGSPHPYDTHVPLLLYGPNVKPGVRRDEVVSAVLASTFARSVGIDPPAKSRYPVPEGLFESK